MIVADDVVAAVLLLLLLIPKLRMQLLLLLPLRDNTSLLALILMDPNSRTKEREFGLLLCGPILKGDGRHRMTSPFLELMRPVDQCHIVVAAATTTAIVIAHMLHIILSLVDDDDGDVRAITVAVQHRGHPCNDKLPPIVPQFAAAA